MTLGHTSARFEELRESRTGLDPSRRMLWDTVVSAAAESSGSPREWTPAEVMAAMSGAPAPLRGAAEALEVFSPATGRGARRATAAAGLQGCWSWTPTDPYVRDCRESLVGDDDTCGILLDCAEATRSISESQLEAMANSCPADFVTLSARGPKIRGETRSERELIRAAWNYLLLNLDIVNWAVCRVTGEVQDTRSIALMRRLVGKSPYRVTVQVFPTPGTYFGLYGTGMIGIPREGDNFTNIVAMWERGDHATRQCAAMDLSVTLLHEVMHLAGYTYIDLGEICYVNHVADNLYRWALFHRYSDASVPDCCKDSNNDERIGSGSTYYVDDDCVIGDSTRGTFGGSSEWVREALWWLVRTPRLAWDVWWFFHRALLGGLIRGARELLDDAGNWLSEVGRWFGDLFAGLGGRSSGSGACGCACEPCYQFCPELWQDTGSGCELRDPDNREAAIRCLQECLMQHDPADTGVAWETDEDSGGDGWQP